MKSKVHSGSTVWFGRDPADFLITAHHLYAFLLQLECYTVVCRHYKRKIKKKVKQTNKVKGGGYFQVANRAEKKSTGHSWNKLHGNRKIVAEWAVERWGSGRWRHRDKFSQLFPNMKLNTNAQRIPFLSHLRNDCADFGTPWFQIVWASREVSVRESWYHPMEGMFKSGPEPCLRMDLNPRFWMICASIMSYWNISANWSLVPFKSNLNWNVWKTYCKFLWFCFCGQG